MAKKHVQGTPGNEKPPFPLRSGLPVMPTHVFVGHLGVDEEAAGRRGGGQIIGV